MTKRTIVVGDIHSCHDELKELLKIASYKYGLDQLIFVGDLIDRGPDSLGVVRLAQELKAISVLGNHEIKFLKWFDGEKQYIGKNKEHYYLFKSRDIEYMRNMPLYYQIDPKLFVIHGGARPGTSIKNQHKRDLCYIRYLNPDNDYTMHKKKDDKCYFWTELWDQKESVIYGHQVHSLKKPRIDIAPSGAMCYGIDTGACFGGFLSSIIYPSMEVVQVKAKKAYKELKPF